MEFLSLTDESIGAIVILAVLVVLFLLYIIILLSRYKRCPANKIMVIYGKVGKTADGTVRPFKCIHGGAAFVMPFIQSYSFLDLTPIPVEIDLKNALSRRNNRIDALSRFTVGISTEPSTMQNAAECLLGLPVDAIRQLAEDIIIGQFRLVISKTEIGKINADRDKFLEKVCINVESELKKIGLRLINVNLKDITENQLS